MNNYKSFKEMVAFAIANANDLGDEPPNEVKKTSMYEREERVYELLIKGMSTSHIGYKLNITYPTAQKYKKLIYKKNGVSNNEELLEVHNKKHNTPLLDRFMSNDK